MLYLNYPLITFLLVAVAATKSPLLLSSLKDFEQNVLHNPTPSLVKYVSPDAQCDKGCQTASKAFDEALQALKGVLNGYEVRGDSKIFAHEKIDLNSPIKVRMYFDRRPQDLKPKQTQSAEALLSFALDQLQTQVKRRAGLSDHPPKHNKKSSSHSAKSAGLDQPVVKLSSRNFDDVVMADSENSWFIKFYAPWCGHCKALEPVWKELGEALQGKVKVGEVNADAEKEFGPRFAIQGFPTLLFFPSGKKTDSKVKSYQGPRELPEMKRWALNLAGVSPGAQQLLSQDQFEKQCSDHLCVLAFLPHIEDSSATERKSYLKVLKQVHTDEEQFPIKYFWIEAGNNLEFEEALHLQFGWPAVIAVQRGKNSYRVHRGGFRREALANWIRGLGTGRLGGDTLPEKLPPLKKMTKWNGKDAPSPPPSSSDEL